jgi:transposase-like protein
VTERRVSAAQAARDTGVHANVLRAWVRELRADPAQAFPGLGWRTPAKALNQFLMAPSTTGVATTR